MLILFSDMVCDLGKSPCWHTAGASFMFPWVKSKQREVVAKRMLHSCSGALGKLAVLGLVLVFLRHNIIQLPGNYTCICFKTVTFSPYVIE